MHSLEQAIVQRSQHVACPQLKQGAGRATYAHAKLGCADEGIGRKRSRSLEDVVAKIKSAGGQLEGSYDEIGNGSACRSPRRIARFTFWQEPV
jgi:hypothetical protein